MLRNYGHIFAVMMRLRQLCCHRELLPVNWGEVDMKDLEELAAQATAEREQAEAMGVEGAVAIEEGEAKKLAEQLKKMIKDGITDDCSICLGDLNHPVITPCCHVYCLACITTCIDASIKNPPPRCPLCRAEVSKKKLLEAAAPEPEEEEDENEDTEGKEFEDIMINISSTKINAVLTVSSVTP